MHIINNLINIHFGKNLHLSSIDNDKISTGGLGIFTQKYC